MERGWGVAPPPSFIFKHSTPVVLCSQYSQPKLSLLIVSSRLRKNSIEVLHERDQHESKTPALSTVLLATLKRSRTWQWFSRSRLGSSACDVLPAVLRADTPPMRVT